MQLIIFVSKNESYLNGASLIKETGDALQLDCDIRYIEDVHFDKYDVSLEKSECAIYFLTNSDRIPQCVKYFDNLTTSTQINRDFLVSGKTKFAIQSCLRLEGVCSQKYNRR